MRKILLLSVVLFWLLPGRGAAQITIHPMAGINYLRFMLPQTFDTHFLEEPGKVDPVFGIAAQMPVHPDWYVKSRITYCRRADKIFSESDFAPKFIEHTHRELSVEFSVNYVINRYFEVGAGPSIVRSFAVDKVNYQIMEDEYKSVYYNLNQFLLGLNMGLSVRFNKLRLHLGYLRIVRESEFYPYGLGKNRFDLTVSYHLLGGKKEKK